jgi:23S rRNA pseudouridine1911/1915/1917 synthase
MTDIPRVIYEDKNFLAVHKPAGLVVHKVKESDMGPTLVSWLLERYPEIRRVGDDPLMRPGIVHRLDRDTSGVLLIPRSPDDFEYLKALFKNREVRKTYLALVFGAVKEKRGVIATPIGRMSGTVKRTVQSLGNTRDARTEYATLRTFQDKGAQDNDDWFSLLSVFPKSGRTHQIRVHLSSVHHPVVGDRVYGPRAQPPWATRLMLHALSLEFTLREGGRIKIEDEAPSEFRLQAAK